MNIKAIFLNHDRYVNKALAKLNPILLSSMERVMAEVKGRAQYKYLRGPYPYRLSFHFHRRTGSALKNNIQTVVRQLGDSVLGSIGLPQLVWYGKVWEAVDEYAHRVGGTFKNGHPMARPFARPAWEDMKKESVYTIKRALAEGLSG